MVEKTECIVETVQKNTIDENVLYKEIKDPYGFIYITTNLINGMRYLGQKKFSDRWQDYLGSGSLFKKALNKYGKENFKRNIVLICYSTEELNQVEYDLSVLLDVVKSKDWYNLVLGGGTSRGWKPTEETRRKIGDATRERLSDPTNHPRYGKPGLCGENNPQFGVLPKDRMDEETYKQWYESHKLYWENPVTKGKRIWENRQHPSLGTHLSDEQKENLSTKAKEKFANPENHPMYGKSQTEHCKERVGAAHRGYNNWNSNAVYCVELNSIFWGATEANAVLRADPSGIIKCCRGKRKTCGKHPITGESLHWLYVHNQTLKDETVILGAIALGYITEKQVNSYLNNLKQKEND